MKKLFSLLAVAFSLTSLAASATGLLIVQEQQAAGTHGGTSVAGTQTRTLNTVLVNTIAGASLSANQVSLPSGTYVASFSCPAYSVDRHQVWLHDITASANYYGANSSSTYGGGSLSESAGNAVFTLAGADVLELVHYTQRAYPTAGLGLNNASGAPSVFCRLSIQQL